MRILSAASEIFPLVKTGGLADVTGALPAALAAQGISVLSIIPGYPAVMAALEDAAVLHVYADLFGGKARLMRGRAKGLEVIAVDAPHLYDRPGNPYLGADGKDWPDNARRFAALSRAAADVAQGRAGDAGADILHCHDWQAALAPVYARFHGGAETVKTVMTVHNIAFQGQFPASVFGTLGLPPQAFAIDGVEYYGNVCFLKGGLATADRITTVSPSYAQEICTPEYGMGLDGLLRARRAISQASSTASTMRFGTRRPIRTSRRPIRPRRWQSAAPTSGRWSSASGWRWVTGCCMAWSAASPGRRAWIFLQPASTS